MHPKDIRISLVIPAYNEERYLARCLEAVAAQSLRPHEVIVVDNGSQDGTTAVAKQYPFVTLCTEPRRGRAFAQAAGFNAATGTVVARIDADAVLPVDWVARISNYFDQPGSMQTAWTSGARFYNVRFPRLISALYDGVAFQMNRLLTGHPTLWGSSMALPRALWQKIAGDVCMRADLHEDLDVSIHLHRAGHTIFYDKHVKVPVELRPVYASPRKLLAYLQLWPRTLAIHRIRTWPLCWIINAFLFVGMPFFGLSERLARLLGRRPL
jgi:glycosyltransferase involved in cell wall biosynthesis